VIPDALATLIVLGTLPGKVLKLFEINSLFSY